MFKFYSNQIELKSSVIHKAYKGHKLYPESMYINYFNYKKGHTQNKTLLHSDIIIIYVK